MFWFLFSLYFYLRLNMIIMLATAKIIYDRYITSTRANLNENEKQNDCKAKLFEKKKRTNCN